jgi:integrase
MKRDRGTGGLFKMKGSPNYYAQIYRDGRPCRVSTGTDVKQEAQGFLRNLLTDADQGKPFIGDVSKITYGQLRAGLMQNYTEKGNRSLLVAADGTEFINGLKALDDYFGYESDEKPGVPVTKITTDSARAFASKRLEEGVTNSTVNNSLKLLPRMLRIAHEDGKIHVVPKIRFYKANSARKGFLPREKFDELLGHLPIHLRSLITFLYYCGVRLGEARTVPLPNDLIQMLRAVEDESGTVFDGTNLLKAWNKACDACSLGTLEPIDKQNNRRYTGLIVHDLRRSAIKNLMKVGVNERVAMAILGHKTVEVFDRYHIVDETDVLEAMRRVQAEKSNGLAVSETSVRVASKRPALQSK